MLGWVFGFLDWRDLVSRIPLVCRSWASTRAICATPDLRDARGLTRYVLAAVVDPQFPEGLLETAGHHRRLDAVRHIVRLPCVDFVLDLVLYHAVEFGHLEVVHELCSLPTVDSAANENHAVRRAARRGHSAIVRFLCSLPNVDPAVRDNYVLDYAVYHGDLDLVKFLCSLPNVNPTASDFPVQRAAGSGHLKVVQFLCSLPGVDPTTNDNNAVRWAAENGHLEVVQFLCSLPGVDPAARNNDAVQRAATRGHSKVVQFLCARIQACTSMCVHHRAQSWHLFF